VQARLPGNLRQALAENDHHHYEVMLLAWSSDGPLPETFGSAVGLELRVQGRETQVAFNPIDPPITIMLPLEKAISTDVNAKTGETYTSYGASFDTTTWAWRSTGMSKVSSTPTVVTMQTSHFSYFSAVQVAAGCDGAALSGVKLDGCEVCGGNNETCSGCDGIPNTGYNRLCSGHGQCGVASCSCVSDWFGVECETFCSNLVTCSGHGFCDAAWSGRRCNCMEGWSTPDTSFYPGPFCDRQDGLVSTTPIGGVPPLEEDDKGGQLALILTLVFSLLALILTGIALWWYVGRQRAVVQAHKKTIIDFTGDDPHIGDIPMHHPAHQPHLLEDGKDGESVDGEALPALPAAAPAPDDDAWGAAELPETTATFSYGPNSGYLASAIAASTRTNMGQLAVERIDRRSRVMERQIKGKNTVAKYKAPAAPNSEGIPVMAAEEQEEYPLLLVNGEPMDTEVGITIGNGRVRWDVEDPGPDDAIASYENGNGNGRYSDHHELGDSGDAVTNGNGNGMTPTWQVTDSPEWVENSQ